MRAFISLGLAFLLAGGAAYARDHKKKKNDSGMEAMPDPNEPLQQGRPPQAKPARPAAAANGGALVSLTVVCVTPGAGIYVDGEQIGMTPMDLPLPVTPGDHSIKVTRLGYAPFIDVFSTKGKSDVKLEMELVPMLGVLHVKSNVPGARVMIDGRYVGDAPIDLETDVGPRAVQLSKGGYKDFFQNVMAVAGQEQPLDANLEELPEGMNPFKPLPPPPPKWYKKPWVWGVVAGGAVLAAGGVVAGVELGARNPLSGADTLPMWMSQ